MLCIIVKTILQYSAQMSLIVLMHNKHELWTFYGKTERRRFCSLPLLADAKHSITKFSIFVIQGGRKMGIVTSTIKGQIVIPADLRKKFKIIKGTRVNVYEENNKIIVEPLIEDPVREGRGMLKTRGRILNALLSDRKKEANR
jgi:AbrB family looped-hinge helix DNA binding protein